MNKEGHGWPGAPKNQQEKTPSKELGTIGSIRADRDTKTFAAGIRQNKEQLLSFAQELISGEAVRAKTKKEAKDNKELGIYMNFAVRHILNPNFQAFEIFSTNPADWRDGYTYHKPMTEAEKRELRVDKAARRVAAKWLKTHPDSGAADHVRDFGIQGVAADIHCELLQEMWPSIRVVARHSLKRK